MTIAEYFETPETVAPQELIFGTVRVADAPFVSHQRIVLRLALGLQRHLETTGGGEVFVAPIDVVLDPDRGLVLQPDLVVVTPDRSPIVAERIHGAPDLVVEVLSPRPRIGALDERVGWFAGYGVREIWLYHQIARRMQVLACAAGRVQSTVTLGWTDALASAVIPDLPGPVRAFVDG